jgi:uncharacterized protein
VSRRGWAVSQRVGAITSLWRFPIKSMRTLPVDSVDVGAGGIVGDRAYALIDVATNKVLSAKAPEVGSRLLSCEAVFVEAPRAGADAPPVQITLGDGTTLSSDAPDTDATLSKFLDREVKLARMAPADYTIDQYHPDVEGADPAGHRDEVTEAKLGEAFFAEAGLPSAVPSGSFFDLFPISVITTSTLAHLGELAPGSRFDERRFRMNVVVRTGDDGFAENDWVGRSLLLGDRARVAVALPDPRCVMTTREQADLPADLNVLRTLVRHNRLDVAGARYPCAGIYAVVETPGAVNTADSVSLA